MSFALLFCFGGCTWNSSRVASQPVIQVNDHALTAKEFAERLARQLKNFDALSAKDPNNVARAKEEVSRAFILRCLTVDYARANGISIADDELSKEVNAVRSNYPDDISFRRALAEEGLSLAEWKENLRQTLLDKKVFDKISEKAAKPSIEELKKFYEENKNKYRRKERIYLRQIVVDDLTKAETLRDELKKKDFIEIANKYSVSPEGKAGGLVGWVERGSVDIFDKAFLLPAGGVSQVLESPYGFHIFKVERKAPAGFATFEEVKKEIEQSFLAKKGQSEFLGWLDKQIRTSRVLKNRELIDAISVETRGWQ